MRIRNLFLKEEGEKVNLPDIDEHGNAKVDFNLVKSEIRISKCETILKFENQMTKIFRELIQQLQDFYMF